MSYSQKKRWVAFWFLIRNRNGGVSGWTYLILALSVLLFVPVFPRISVEAWWTVWTTTGGVIGLLFVLVDLYFRVISVRPTWERYWVQEESDILKFTSFDGLGTINPQFTNPQGLRFAKEEIGKHPDSNIVLEVLALDRMTSPHQFLLRIGAVVTIKTEKPLADWNKTTFTKY